MLLRIARIIAAESILVMCASLALAQPSVPASGAALAFEVAIIKPNDANGTVTIKRLPGGRWIATNASLRLLITWAYDITDERLVGEPGWVDSARFDVTAQAPNDNPTRDQLRLMVQSLLADRFNLCIRREPRQLPLYRLEMDAGGPKVQLQAIGTAISQDPFNMTVLG
jgi:uncharacterized protein (TIGR03435 family)